MDKMDLETANVEELETYLKSFGGLWAKLPESLEQSLKTLTREEQQLEYSHKIQQTREQSYEYVIRRFAKKCQEIMETS